MGGRIVPIGHAHETWRGQFTDGTCVANGGADCGVVPWPGWRTTAYHAMVTPPSSENWRGGLVDGMRDATGQMYRRNRYYDSQTGQFTQPDPIGLAGGLNSYGFAAGDPVSYDDPYGLCPPCGPDEYWNDQAAEGLRRGGVRGAIQAAVGIGFSTLLEATGVNEISRAGDQIRDGNTVGGIAMAGLAIASNTPVGRGLRGASTGVRALFNAGGGLADNTLVGVRATLTKSGFTMRLADNRRGYVYSNQAGEQVRLMRGNQGWYMRVRNKDGNYLDTMGNPGSQATTHLPVRNH